MDDATMGGRAGIAVHQQPAASSQQSKKERESNIQTDARTHWQPWRACWERGGRLFCTPLASNVSFGFNLSSQPALAHTRQVHRASCVVRGACIPPDTMTADLAASLPSLPSLPSFSMSFVASALALPAQPCP
jgi:hypothetical protein